MLKGDLGMSFTSRSRIYEVEYISSAHNSAIAEAIHYP